MIIYRIDNNGCVGEGFVSTRDEGLLITYMTFDGYVDDGYFSSEAEAINALKKAISRSKKIAKEYSRRAVENGGMY